MPMRPIQNAMAIIATFFAAGALLPWSPRFRLTCAFAAAALILILLVLRLKDHASQRVRQSDRDSAALIARIRADREKRFGRRP
jgi:hypothetical protein